MSKYESADPGAITERPRVSVGVPVRNGGPDLWGALSTLTSQTHTNLEIIISDNASTDETQEIALRFAAVDDRVTYIRQPHVITAIENFKTVLFASSSEYFLWAAHDDRRSENYVEILLKGFERNQTASLVFSELVRFHDFAEVRGVAQKAALESKGLSVRARIRSYPLSRCAELYGLHRTDIAKRYSWQDIDFSPDVPFLVYESMRGDFVYQPGTTFYQWLPLIQKNPADRARENALSGLRPFRVIRLAIAISRAASEGRVAEGQRKHALTDLLTAYWSLRNSLTKTWVFEHSPPCLQNVWRRLKFRKEHRGQTSATSDFPQPGNQKSLPTESGQPP